MCQRQRSVPQSGALRILGSHQLVHKLGDCHSKEEQGSLPDVAVIKRITGEEEDLVANRGLA